MERLEAAKGRGNEHEKIESHPGSMLHLNVMDAEDHEKVRNRYKTKKEKEKIQKGKIIKSICQSKYEDENEIKEEKLLMFRSYTYTVDSKIAIMVNKIRQITPPKVYIAEGTAITYISYMRKNLRWRKIEGQFGHVDVSRKPDGIYLFPTFSRITCNHWHTVILRKRASLWFGWNIDTIRHGKQERYNFVKRL